MRSWARGWRVGGVCGGDVPAPPSRCFKKQCVHPQGSFSISCRSDLNLTGIPSHLPITIPPTPAPAPYYYPPFPYLMGTTPHPTKSGFSLRCVWFPLQPEEEASTLTACLPAVPVISPLCPFRQPRPCLERALTLGSPPQPRAPTPSKLGSFQLPSLSGRGPGRSSPFNLGRMQFPASGAGGFRRLNEGGGGDREEEKLSRAGRWRLSL